MVTVTKTKASDLMNDTTTSDNDDEKGPTTKIPAASAENIKYIRQSDSLIVTDSCLNRIEKLIKQRRQKKASSSSASENEDDDGPYFLRVFVDAGGCSGFQYQFEVASDYDEQEDVVIVAAVKTPSSSLEPRVVVDETSLGFLEGSTLDYVIEMIKSSFTIRDNPKSESACGCGSSFAVKNFSSNPALD
jgi:iron-sulfur cluster assembly accessory protein